MRPTPDDDPVLRRRATADRLASTGQRVGYLLFGLAIVAFVAGFLTDFPSWSVRVVVWSLVLGSVVLAPAIVLGYAVRAAEREERGERGFH